jgi:hypothetical protein
VDGRLVVEPPIEVVLVLAERGGQRPQHLAADPQRLGLPAQHDAAQLGQRGRPLVGADQPQVVRVTGTGVQGRPLRADVDLLAPVGAARGVFGSGARIAAELGRVEVLDLQPLFFRQREEGTGGAQSLLPYGGGDTVTGDVEEPHLVCGCAQPREKRLAVGGGVAEAGDIDDGQRWQG